MDPRKHFYHQNSKSDPCKQFTAKCVCARVYVCVENIEILYCYSRLILKLRSLILPFESLFSSFYIL